MFLTSLRDDEKGGVLGEYSFILIRFALPFLQAVRFLQASGMMKRLACAHFSSES